MAASSTWWPPCGSSRSSLGLCGRRGRVTFVVSFFHFYRLRTFIWNMKSDFWFVKLLWWWRPSVCRWWSQWWRPKHLWWTTPITGKLWTRWITIKSGWIRSKGWRRWEKTIGSGDLMRWRWRLHSLIPISITRSQILWVKEARKGSIRTNRLMWRRIMILFRYVILIQK